MPAVRINPLMRLLERWRLLVLLSLATTPALAQLSGSRDLTVFWRAPVDHVPSPSAEACPSPRSSISDGVIVDGVATDDAKAKSPESTELTIVKITPAKLQAGSGFTATLRFKNTGTAAVRIPWQPDGETVVRPAADGSE